jgi:hypothetical protein
MVGMPAGWLDFWQSSLTFERRGRETAAGKSVSGFGFGFLMKRERRRGEREEMGNLREKERERWE